MSEPKASEQQKAAKPQVDDGSPGSPSNPGRQIPAHRSGGQFSIHEQRAIVRSLIRAG